MNKGWIARELSYSMGMTQEAGKRCLDHLLRILEENIQKYDKVGIQGFGTFKKSSVKGKRLKIPSTWERCYVKPYTTLTFKPSKRLRDSLKTKKT